MPPQAGSPRQRSVRRWCASILLIPSLAIAAADTVPADAPPASIVPKELLSVPDGLEVTIWAGSPQIRNPTNIDIDAAGRIWVAEGVNYRRHAERDRNGDRIMVLVDADGDGRADTSTVFVQEPMLIAPLGIAVIDNQVIVSNAPDMIIYTDVDRDLRFDASVDKRDVLLTGFNGANHDHALHSVTFGPDGWWYFNHGNSGALFTDRSGRTFRIGSVYDPLGSGATPLFGWNPLDIAGARSDDGHVYVGGFAARMRPDGTDVQVIGFNFRNSYEQTVTSFGDVFQNDNDDPPACRTAFLLEYGNAGFFSRDGQRSWNADRRPGQSIPTAEWRQEDPGTMPGGDVYGAGAPTGIVFYEGDTLGEHWRGLLLSGEAARNTVFGYLPEPAGAGFVLARFDFLTSNREREFAGTDMLRGKVSPELKTFFRPSDVAVGPDGAIYVADWFDPRAGGHQDLDEGTAGAIYRIAPKGFRSRVPHLNPETVEGLLTALRSPAVNVRAIGFNRLAAAGARSLGPVASLLADANPYVRARAVWLLSQLGTTGIARVEEILAGDDERMRSTAFRALRRVKHRVLEHAMRLSTDPSPAVRREVALAMRDVPLADARGILLNVARGFDGRDRTYLEAWGIGCTGKEAQMHEVLAALSAGTDPLTWTPAHAMLVWRLTPAAAAPAFAARAAARQLSESDRLAAVTALGFLTVEAAPRALLDLAEHADGMVKRHALWWLLNYRKSRWAAFPVDAELKRRGLYNPDETVVIPSVVPEPEPGRVVSAVPAAIAALKGNATNGAEKVQSCFLCHKLGEQGTDYAPDLTGWVSRQTSEVAIQAIVDPSADIAHGFEGHELVMHDGTIVHGIVESWEDPMVVRSMGGVTQLIPASRVKEQKRLGRSLMLSAGQLGMSAQDVADIVAYLRSLPAP